MGVGLDGRGRRVRAMMGEREGQGTHTKTRKRGETDGPKTLTLRDESQVKQKHGIMCDMFCEDPSQNVPGSNRVCRRETCVGHIGLSNALPEPQAGVSGECAFLNETTMKFRGLHSVARAAVTTAQGMQSRMVRRRERRFRRRPRL